MQIILHAFRNILLSLRLFLGELSGFEGELY